MNHVAEEPGPGIGNVAGDSQISEATATKQVPPWLRRQQALVAMGRRAAGPPERAILMQDAAALLAEVLDAEYSAAAELSADGQRLSLQLSPSHENGGRPSCWDTPAEGSKSLAGYVLQVAHPCSVPDLTEETRFRDAGLVKQGIRSAVAAPLKLHDSAFGALLVCSAEVRPFDESDILFVETIAHLVAATIGRKQAEQSLAEQNRIAADVLEAVDAMVLVLDPEGQILNANAACERIGGFSSAEIRSRALWSAFALPEEASLFRDGLARAERDSGESRFETWLLTKRGQRRRIAWICRAIGSAAAGAKNIVATALDVTELREAEEKVRRAEEDSHKARQAVVHALDLNTVPGDGPEYALRDAGQAKPFTPLPLPPGAERRKRHRRSYPYHQRIGSVVDGKLPECEQFYEVRCNDIAAGGFSYFTPSPPTSDTIVVALGAPPRMTYLLAQVAHVTRTEDDGQRVFLVGCNYIGRAEY